MGPSDCERLAAVLGVQPECCTVCHDPEWPGTRIVVHELHAYLVCCGIFNPFYTAFPD